MTIHDPAGLPSALADLDRSNRHGLTVALAELRDRRATAGDPRVAAVFAAFAALVADVDDAEQDMLEALAADIGGAATIIVEDPAERVDDDQ